VGLGGVQIRNLQRQLDTEKTEVSCDENVARRAAELTNSNFDEFLKANDMAFVHVERPNSAGCAPVCPRTNLTGWLQNGPT